MHSQDKIFIFGGSHHAKLTIDIIEKEGKYCIIGILDSKKTPGTKLAGYNILGPIEDLDVFCKKYNVRKGIIAIGDNYQRFKVSQHIIDIISDFEFISAVHPSVIMGSRARVGVGSILAAGVIINNDSIIGEHCWLAFKSGLSHDGKMGDFASLGPGAIAGGNVHIGSYSAIGLGAMVLNRRKIGSHSIVGSASLVYHNVESSVVVMGIPARVIRKREKDEPYL